ncbi:TraQ conjugal transfer family protein, partial [Capnocytophaga gingivalis]|uniref:TraQ conjugal transfer family protein n=1 Tax=Capnocytophaga gingivalis TaxID=1017 RepID=UPI003C703AB0
MKKINQKIVIGLIAILCVSLFTSCEKELDVQQNFPFEVKVLPVPKSIGKTDTVEIRCELRSPYQYDENRYFIRYFQYEGKGSLRTSPQGEALFANDVYPLASKGAFRLY